MKTKSSLKSMIVAGLLLLSLLTVQTSKAQIANPFSCVNLLTCDVEISYTIYDAGCTIVCCGLLHIPAGQTKIINCGNAAPNFDDINILVLWIDNPSCPATQTGFSSTHGNCFGPSTSTGLVASTGGCGLCTSATLNIGYNHLQITP